MNAIELRDLEKHYRDFDLRISLTLPQGCILGLVGENGAGKSTTIRMLLGMTRPDGGSLRVLGQPQADKEQIGVVLEVACTDLALAMLKELQAQDCGSLDHSEIGRAHV